MEPIVLGAVGGLLIQLLSLAELAKVAKSRRPDFKDFIYWLPYFINPFFGAVLAYAYFDGQDHVNKLLAIHVGASAPLIIRSMISTIPTGIKNQSDK
ncbi:hypothetical protein [Mucilaginibacter sp. L3T2-6]|uniref:hypothetical protein n=1 Tax=Mucilaginibacter sp. L3T2-6 TaxID=3062491 RepID=UPI0026768238|nr:hypothetical protein [Mucilaginibacter sp. L3T2-6]MDO3641505.1 hypothetical protein [Mucilaginibacter sp. L3T2-6]MDV6213734.1 hypothetical protein [Mucilaginibacter sp. L3T2-6]